MHLTKKGGVTPCDRRFDRGKVAIAAAAALLLFATAAQAQQTLVINPTLSSITFGETINLAALGFPGDDGHGNYAAVPQLGQAGSMTTNYSGTIMLNTSTPGSIQLLPNGSQINALNNGVWYPGENPNGSVGTPTLTGGTVGPAPGNYGFQFTSLSALGNTHNLILNILPFNQDAPIGAGGIGNSPMTLSGTNFSMAGQSLVATDGIQDIWAPAAVGGPTQALLDDIASVGADQLRLSRSLGRWNWNLGWHDFDHAHCFNANPFVRSRCHYHYDYVQRSNRGHRAGARAVDDDAIWLWSRGPAELRLACS